MTQRHRWLLPWLAAALLAVPPIATAGSAGASTTLRLVTDLGNGSHGRLVKKADAVSGQLVGAAGTGLTRGVTSTSVRFGCMNDAALYPGFQTGIDAAFHVVNERGGIFGRKLTLAGPCDDTHDLAATDTADAETLVDQTHIFALLTLGDAQPAGTTRYLNDRQVPYAGWGTGSGFCGTRWGFGWNGCLDGATVTEPVEAIAGSLVEATIRASGMPDAAARIAVLSDGALDGVAREYAAEIATLGSQLVYSEDTYPATSSGVNIDPYPQAIMAAQPNVVVLLLPSTDVGPVTAALKAQGYNGLVTIPTSAAPFQLQAMSADEFQLGLSAVYYTTQAVPPQQHSAYGDAVASALTAVGSTSVTLGAFVGYCEAEMLAEMIRAAGRKLDTRSFTASVNGPSGGLTSYATAPAGGPGKLAWPAAHYLPADCAAVVKATGTTNVHAVVPFSCYTSFEVTKGD